MKAEVGKYYIHNKNKKKYIVLALGYYTEEEPLLPCVVYQAQYDDTALGVRPIFIRPQEMFEELVEHEGELVDRFRQTISG